MGEGPFDAGSDSSPDCLTGHVPRKANRKLAKIVVRQVDCTFAPAGRLRAICRGDLLLDGMASAAPQRIGADRLQDIQRPLYDQLRGGDGDRRAKSWLQLVICFCSNGVEMCLPSAECGGGCRC